MTVQVLGSGLQVTERGGGVPVSHSSIKNSLDQTSRLCITSVKLKNFAKL